MIRQTLSNTKAATFSVDARGKGGLPRPSGTGFFVSPEGLFITARHVLTQDGNPAGPLRENGSLLLMQPDPAQPYPVRLNCYYRVELVGDEPGCDFALLKVDLKETSPWLTQRDRAPFLEVSLRPLDEGEPVYSFGYPLPQSVVVATGPNSFSGGTRYSPRTTSAIVASSAEFLGVGEAQPECLHYVLDKAMNYGNSGGPVVATATGKVHAFCSRFQPVAVAQPHLGASVNVFIPSLYGVATSLAAAPIVSLLRAHGVSPSHV
jgi:S1-C subfamily serine protease